MTKLKSEILNLKQGPRKASPGLEMVNCLTVKEQSFYKTRSLRQKLPSLVPGGFVAGTHEKIYEQTN